MITYNADTIMRVYPIIIVIYCTLYTSDYPSYYHVYLFDYNGKYAIKQQYYRYSSYKLEWN